MGAQQRPFAHPPTDTEVRMVTLGKHPAVTAGHHAELDPRRRVIRLSRERLPAHVPLERDPAHDPTAEPRVPRDDAVRAVGPDEICSTHQRPANPRGDAAVSDLELVDVDAVAEVRPGGRCLLREVQVEPASLGHHDERIRARARNLSSVAGPHHHPVDDVFDDRPDIARKVLQCAPGEPPPHGLSRGNRALSTSSTRAPECARRIAVTDPAGPAPTTRTSMRSTPRW